MRMQALDGLDANHAFMFGFVRQKRRTGDIADRIESRYVGFAHPIDDDKAALGFHTELFQTEVLDIANDADRRDDALDRERLCAALAVIDRRGDAVRFFIELGQFGAGEYLDALFFEALAGKDGDLAILNRQDLRQHFDHGHLRAEGAVEGSEFDTDRARADNEQRFRYPIRHHGFEIGPHQFLVGLDARQHARPRAGRDDDMLGLIGAGAERALGRFAATGLYGDFAGRVDNGLAPYHIDLVFLHEKADAVVEPLGDGARALDHSAGIVGDLASRQSVILGVLQIVQNLSRAKECFGRDAAPVEANAAEIITLDNGRIEPKLRGPDSSDVAAGSRTDDDNIVTSVSHSFLVETQPRRTLSSISAVVAGGASAPLI